nr:MAG TPA: hypothetical protein [Caudoviricetes sp.]
MFFSITEARREGAMRRLNITRLSMWRVYEYPAHRGKYG